MTVKAIDVSGYQPAHLGRLKDATGAEHACVKLHLSVERSSDLLVRVAPRTPQEHSIAQIESCREVGMTVSTYLFLYPDVDPGESVEQAFELADRAGHTPKVMWVDWEPYKGRSAVWWDVEEALQQIKKHGVRAGLYTGKYMWDTVQGEWRPECVLWDARWDGRPVLTHPGYGPWKRVVAKQYMVDEELGVDLDVWDVRYAG